MEQDQEHLRLLLIFHYILAAIVGLFALFPLIHVGVGIAMLAGAFPHEDDALLAGVIFVAVGSVCILLGWTLAILLFLGARNSARRSRRVFCLVVAGISCLFMPLGTVLGVFTIVVLIRPSVVELFDTESRAR